LDDVDNGATTLKRGTGLVYRWDNIHTYSPVTPDAIHQISFTQIVQRLVPQEILI